MGTRTVTGTIYHLDGTAWAAGEIKFTLMEAFETSTETYPRETHTETLNSRGAFSITLGVPDSGTAHYQVETPDKLAYDFFLAAGAATTLETILLIAGSPVSQDAVQTLIDAHIINYHPEYNVKTYGAKGDGVTDDTTAIQDAIDAISAEGGTLYFPAGKYVTIGGFIISKNCTIKGDGASGSQYARDAAISQIICNSRTAVLFTITADIVLFEKLSLRNTAVLTPTAGAGIAVIGTNEFSRCNFENIVVDGFWINVDVQASSKWVMHGCLIQYCMKYGIKIQNIENIDEGDWEISDTQVINNPSISPTIADAGIRYESGGGGKITNCRVHGSDGFTRGIDLAVIAGAATSEFYISNTAINSTINDNFRAYLQAGGGNAWSRIFLSNCFFGGFAVDFAGHSISITSILQVIITGCTFYRTYGDPAIAAVDLTLAFDVHLNNNFKSGYDILYTTDGVSTIWDNSGSIGGDLALDAPNAALQIPYAESAISAKWCYPAWMKWETYLNTIKRTPNLAGYWRLGELSGTTAEDSGPNNIDGTYINNPTLSQTGAISGDNDTAVLFDDASIQYVNIGNDSDLEMTTAVSIEGWFKSSTGGGGTIFSRRNDDLGYQLKVDTIITFNVGDDSNMAEYLSNAISVLDGNWHHVVAVRDGIFIRLYLDGALIKSLLTTIGSMAGAAIAAIGSLESWDYHYNLMHGTLDEVAVYSRALTSAEVDAHYRLGMGL